MRTLAERIFLIQSRKEIRTHHFQAMQPGRAMSVGLHT